MLIAIYHRCQEGLGAYGFGREITRTHPSFLLFWFDAITLACGGFSLEYCLSCFDTLDSSNVMHFNY